MNDKTFMLLTALASILVAIHACFVTYAITAAMIVNAIFCFVMAFKIDSTN